jgi:serine/threonine-protein phosphatase 2A activator
LAINEAIKGKSNTKGSENSSESVKKMVKMLDQLDAKIDETPPIQQPQRFGNVAFRTWFQKMKDVRAKLLARIVTQK